jgi:hypothetical protein
MGPPPSWRVQLGTRWRLGSQATWPASQVEQTPPTISMARAELPQTLASQPRSWAGQLTPRPTRHRVWPTWSTCQIHPHGDDDFDIWSTSLCHPLKCSNLVPKFLKSNKHYNCGTRLADKVNTWLFHIFTRHVGA